MEARGRCAFAGAARQLRRRRASELTQRRSSAQGRQEVLRWLWHWCAASAATSAGEQRLLGMPERVLHLIAVHDDDESRVCLV